MSNFDKAIEIILAEPPEMHYPAYYADLLSKAYYADLLREADVTGKNVGKCSEIPNSSDTISRQAVKYLDLFTKIYCRDKSVTDDLVFRCKECEFEMPDGKCLAKCMAHKLCPDYREFGSMGDL